MPGITQKKISRKKKYHLYLDVCCLNRPFDDQQQDRIRLESEAVLLIIHHCAEGDWEWIGSRVIDFEVQRTPDTIRRHRVALLAAQCNRYCEFKKAHLARTQELRLLGFMTIDALHIAMAESAKADFLLTTDDKLIRVARRHASKLKLYVNNPLTWLRKEAIG